jgi:hypothetical protein
MTLRVFFYAIDAGIVPKIESCEKGLIKKRFTLFFNENFSFDSFQKLRSALMEE